MPRLFISYRREDTAGHAGRLYDRLCARYGDGSVFIDRYDLRPGQIFRMPSTSTLARADVLLVVIGPRWLAARGDDGRPRLEEGDDFVRREILAALTAGKQVIPILVGGAAMPGAHRSCPASWRHWLAFRHGSCATGVSTTI